MRAHQGKIKGDKNDNLNTWTAVNGGVVTGFWMAQQLEKTMEMISPVEGSCALNSSSSFYNNPVQNT